MRGTKKAGVVRASGGGRERGGGVGGSAWEDGGVGGERETQRKRGNISGYNGSRLSGAEGVFSTSASRRGERGDEGTRQQETEGGSEGGRGRGRKGDVGRCTSRRVTIVSDESETELQQSCNRAGVFSTSAPATEMQQSCRVTIVSDESENEEHQRVVGGGGMARSGWGAGGVSRSGREGDMKSKRKRAGAEAVACTGGGGSRSRGGAKDYLHYSARFGGVEHCVGEYTEPRLTRRYSIYLLY